MGDAEVELAVALGTKTAFDSTFVLLGSPAAGNTGSAWVIGHPSTIADVSMAQDLINNSTFIDGDVSDPPPWKHTGTYPIVNFENTGGGGHYGNNSDFPGGIGLGGAIVSQFATETKATILIPNSGQWTFGVTSDDGFLFNLTGYGSTYTFSFPLPRGPGDTLRSSTSSSPASTSWT